MWKIQEPARWATVVAFGLLIAIFLVMLFPLWPYELRVGVSYISMGLAIALVAFLVSLFTIRPLVWYVSSFFAPPGLWILPNANEDVGFFEVRCSAFLFTLYINMSATSRSSPCGRMAHGSTPIPRAFRPKRRRPPPPPPLLLAMQRPPIPPTPRRQPRRPLPMTTRRTTSRSPPQNLVLY